MSTVVRRAFHYSSVFQCQLRHSVTKSSQNISGFFFLLNVLALYSGLNCILPNFFVGHSANVEGFGNKNVTEVVKLNCFICLDLRISVLLKETRVHAIFLLHDERPCEAAFCKLGREISLGANLAYSLILEFLAYRTSENKQLMFNLPTLWYFFMQDRTANPFWDIDNNFFTEGLIYIALMQFL